MPTPSLAHTNATYQALLEQQRQRKGRARFLEQHTITQPSERETAFNVFFSGANSNKASNCTRLQSPSSSGSSSGRHARSRWSTAHRSVVIKADDVAQLKICPTRSPEAPYTEDNQHFQQNVVDEEDEDVTNSRNQPLHIQDFMERVEKLPYSSFQKLEHLLEQLEQESSTLIKEDVDSSADHSAESINQSIKIDEAIAYDHDSPEGFDSSPSEFQQSIHNIDFEHVESDDLSLTSLVETSPLIEIKESNISNPNPNPNSLDVSNYLNESFCSLDGSEVFDDSFK
ncbi:hypothetical protein P9112_005295 [Eukaryota sp. TZLM1-RC]